MSGKSCLSNLLESLECWIQALDDGYGLDIIYLDYRKAFDSPIRSNVSAMSDSDVGDQQMLITVLTNFQNFIDIPFISTCGRYPVHERFPLSSSSSFAFNHPGQFQLILSHNMTHKSDLPANNYLQEIP